MTISFNVPAWAFVIDTDTYAGNFERELCAYLTGSIGECGVGSEVAKLFFQDMGKTETEWTHDKYSLFQNIESVPDDNGCFRPVATFPTVGWWNNGKGKHYRDGKGPKVKTRYPAYLSVAIFFSADPTDTEITVMKERTAKFQKMNKSFGPDFSFSLVKFEMTRKRIPL